MPHAASAPAPLSKLRFRAGAAALFAALACGTLYGQATLLPNPQDFGNVIVGQSSSPITITFTNNSSASEMVNSVVPVPSSTGSDFSVQSSSTCPTIVPAHGTCVINIVFSPAAAGAASGQITVSSTDPASPQTLSLTGTGIAATTTSMLTPHTQMFPATTDGTSSSSIAFTLTNTGNTAISDIQIGATGDYSGTPINCPVSPATLAPSASCTIDVVFSPSPPGAGTRNGTLTVSSTSSSGTLTSSLTGTAISNLTGLTFSAPNNALSMGSYEVAAGSSPPAAVTLTNNDPNTVTFAAPVGARGVAFPVTGDFSQSNNCGQTIASGASCTLNIAFTPTATGSRTGSLTVNSTGSTGTQVLGLSGIGTDYTIATTTPSVTVVQGSTAVYRIAFTPISGYSNTITMGCAGLSVPGTSCAGNPTVTLGPATTVNFSVTTTPKNYGGIVANGLAPSAWGARSTWAISLCSLLLLALAGRTRRLARSIGLLALLLALLWPAGGCSGKQPTPDPDATPPGTYTFSLTTVDALQQPKTLSLTLVVTGQ